ncbi:hypothetical protein TWF696_008986 [Orbilia brochopaga]|uniref:Uncharacterized protein n=1 Tax=Orbilia brochopaga TaxID=3140254 RepID=A0AAV9UHX5_9PEZI
MSPLSSFTAALPRTPSPRGNGVREGSTPVVGYVIMALCLITFSVSLIPMICDVLDAVQIAYAYFGMLGAGILARFPLKNVSGTQRRSSLASAFAEWADVSAVLPVVELVALVALVGSFASRRSRLAGELGRYIGLDVEEAVFLEREKRPVQIGTAGPLHSAPQPRGSDVDELRRRLRSNDEHRASKARNLRVREIRRSVRRGGYAEVATQTECRCVCVGQRGGLAATADKPLEIVLAVVAESVPEAAGELVGGGSDAGLATATVHPATALGVVGIVDDGAAGAVAGAGSSLAGELAGSEAEEAGSHGDEEGDAQGHGGARPEEQSHVVIPGHGGARPEIEDADGDVEMADYEAMDEEEEEPSQGGAWPVSSSYEEQPGPGDVGSADEEEAAEYEGENEEEDEEEDEDEGAGGARQVAEWQAPQEIPPMSPGSRLARLLAIPSPGTSSVGGAGRVGVQESSPRGELLPTGHGGAGPEDEEEQTQLERDLLQFFGELPEEEAESESESESGEGEGSTVDADPEGERGEEQRGEEEGEAHDDVPEADRASYIARPNIRPLPRRRRLLLQPQPQPQPQPQQAEVEEEEGPGEAGPVVVRSRGDVVAEADRATYIQRPNIRPLPRRRRAQLQQPQQPREEQ